MQHKDTHTFTEWLKFFEKNKNTTTNKTTFNSKDSVYNKTVAFPKATVLTDINTKDLNNN